MNSNIDSLKNCTLCPRKCGVNRLDGKVGFCKETAAIRAARAALHMWEEPCISGEHGSGAVFFSGCNLGCVFCQNHEISNSTVGREISTERLADIFLSLQAQKANNINLVTPTHFVPQIVSALKLAKNHGLSIPIVYNTGSYENVETIKMLDGLVDIYLPDLKYYDATYAVKYSSAPNYFTVATNAIAEMYRQVGTPVFAPEEGVSASEDADISEAMLLKKGIIVRHLLLPGLEEDSFQILKYLFETYGHNIYLSIMNQYTPLRSFEQFPNLNERINPAVYDKLLDRCIDLGIENAFIQEGDVASDSFIPLFDYEGL